MKIRVECYAGYRGEEEPRAFTLGERRMEVRAILDRWLAPVHPSFQGPAFCRRHLRPASRRGFPRMDAGGVPPGGRRGLLRTVSPGPVPPVPDEHAVAPHAAHTGQ